jgi:lysophospholipase L1-like esterase
VRRGAGLPAALLAAVLACTTGCEPVDDDPVGSMASIAAPNGPGYPATGPIPSGGFLAVSPNVTGANLRYRVSPPLPARLALDPQSGLIAGLVGDAVGTRTYVIDVSNAAGSLQLPLTLSIAAALPQSCPDAADGRDCNRFHQSVREFALANQLAQAPDVPYFLVLGDSIVEAARLDETCGLRPLNGGVGGARTADLIGMARRVGARESLDLLVIAVGINDASPPRIATTEEFTAAYEQLLAEVALPAERLVLVGIAPLERDQPLGTSYFDAARAREFDRVIRSIANRIGAAYVDLAIRLGTSDGTARVGTTLDGVHLTPASYDVWRAGIADAIATSGACLR